MLDEGERGPGESCVKYGGGAQAGPMRMFHGARERNEAVQRAVAKKFVLQCKQRVRE